MKTKFLMSLVAVAVLSGCGGGSGGDSSTPNPEVKPPIEKPEPETDGGNGGTTEPDTKPPVNPDGGNGNGGTVTPPKPEPDTDGDGGITPPPVVDPDTGGGVNPPKPEPEVEDKRIIDNELCKGLSDQIQKHSTYYCWAGSKDEALAFNNVFPNIVPTDSTCEAELKKHEELDGQGYGYTSSQCFESTKLHDAILPDWDCDSLSGTVDHGKFFYCSTNDMSTADKPENLNKIIGGDTLEACEAQRSSDGTNDYITQKCFDGTKRSFEFTLGKAQILLGDELQLGRTASVCSGDSEYKNAVLGDNYDILECSNIVNYEDAKVRAMRKVGSDYLITVSRQDPSYNTENSGGYISHLLETFIVKGDGSKSALLSSTNAGGMGEADLETQIGHQAAMINESFKVMIEPNSRFNRTNDIAYLDTNNHSLGSNKIVLIKPDFTTRIIEIDVSSFTDNAQYGYIHSLLISDDVFIAEVSVGGNKLVRAWDMQGKPVRIEIGQGRSLVGFNEAGNIISVHSTSETNEHYMTTYYKTTEEYTRSGELVKQLDKVVTDGLETYLAIPLNNQYLYYSGIAIDLKTGEIGKVSCSGEGAPPYMYTNVEPSFAIEGDKPSLVCNSYYSDMGVNNNYYTEGFVRIDLDKGVKGIKSTFVPFVATEGLKPTKALGVNMKAVDQYGGNYVINSFSGETLSESHFSDIIINN